jgi:hypothetical protein
MEEDLETAELKEKIDEHVEHHEHGAKAGGPKWTTYLSVSTALIAVLAAISSLLSGSNSNEAILNKSEAMLAQSQASDRWSYYQAKSVKSAIATRQSELLAVLHPDGFQPAADKLAKAAKGYEAEEESIKKEAEKLEEEVKASNERSEALMERHHKFAITVTMLQIAIALSAIAALTKKKPMWFVGLAASAAGIAMFVLGLLS